MPSDPRGKENMPLISFDHQLVRRNALLRSLPEETLQEIAPHLEPIDIRLREELLSCDAPMDYVYFPCACIIGLVARESAGGSIGITLIGNEGFVGLEVVTDRHDALQTAICRTPGLALRVKRHRFAAAMRRAPGLRAAAMRYFQRQMRELALLAACNQMHTIEQRLVKWILLTADRSGPRFQLTQEQLAELVGTHRPGISLAAAALQQAGLIAYRRGNMTVLDRPAMESRSCACYARMRPAGAPGGGQCSTHTRRGGSIPPALIAECTPRKHRDTGIKRKKGSPGWIDSRSKMNY